MYDAINNVDITDNSLDYTRLNEINLDDRQQEYSLESDTENISEAINYKEKKSLTDTDEKTPDYSDKETITEYQPELPYTGESILGKFIPTNEKAYETTSENPIDLLMSQEPDFMSNMYNVYFIVMPKDMKVTKSEHNSKELFKYTGVTNIDMSKFVEKLDKDSGRNYLVTDTNKKWSIISTRIESIDIPMFKQTVQQIRFAGQVINKIVGKKERATKVDLNIRLDQSMYILDAFHALNGDFWASERKRLENGKQIYSGKQFYNLMGLAASSTNIPAIDIVVEYDANYMTFSSYHDKAGTIGFKDDSTLVVPKEDDRWLSKKGRIQRYVFHDCKFLGHSSAIDFKSSGAEPLSATFPFTFRTIMHSTATPNATLKSN